MTSEDPPFTADVFIAGAGPAGLACAIAAAQQGLSVNIADGMAPPIDKACGEGLLPETVASLTSLGIAPHKIPWETSHPLLGIRFIGPPRQRRGTSAHASSVQASFSGNSGIGLERTTLHQLLLDRAASLGVRLHWRTVVQNFQQHSGTTVIQTNQGLHRARFIVGADGHASRIRTIAGLDHGRTTSHRFGLRQHFSLRPWSSFAEVFWSNHGEAYITPVGPSKVCVAFLSDHRFTSVADALSCFPELSARLSDAPAADAPRAAISLSRRLRAVTSGNVALLGDASGSVDAVTGEGLAIAFSQAQVLASALRSGDLRSYQRQHQAIRRVPAFMSSAMLLLDRSLVLRDLTLATFDCCPAIFRALLRFHTANHGRRPTFNTSDSSFPESQHIPYTGIISLSVD